MPQLDYLVRRHLITLCQISTSPHHQRTALRLWCFTNRNIPSAQHAFVTGEDQASFSNACKAKPTAKPQWLKAQSSHSSCPGTPAPKSEWHVPGGICSQRRQDGCWDRGRLYPADCGRHAATGAGHQAFAAIRSAGCSGMQGAESEFRNGSRAILIRVEDTMMKIFVLVALTFALIALADWAPNKASDRDAL